VNETGARIAKPIVTDVVDEDVIAKYARLEGRADEKLHERLSRNLTEVSEFAPPLELSNGDVRMQYVPCAIRLPDVPLEEINSVGGRGRSGGQLWHDVVVHAFGIR
jgi:hypothetical protein